MFATRSDPAILNKTEKETEAHTPPRRKPRPQMPKGQRNHREKGAREPGKKSLTEEEGFGKGWLSLLVCTNSPDHDPGPDVPAWQKGVRAIKLEDPLCESLVDSSVKAQPSVKVN